jgi:two-component system KDP operon response regulator KdpE
LVDDDPEILRTLSIALRSHGYEVECVSRGRAAVDEAAAGHYDAVVLDLGLPDVDGATVISKIRALSEAPLLVLTGRSDLTTKVEALDAGADDYLTKPFSIEELLARLRALSRRSVGGPSETTVRVGAVSVDFTQRVAQREIDGRVEDVHLTAQEWKLLEALCTRPGRLVARRTLLREVWGKGYPEDANHLRVYMARLRAKLEEDPARPRHLLNEHGMGYRFSP